jgi:NAD(P)-dependent dehydrogenase (short-subunit alcohol dehydrogenase family)
MIRQPQWGGPVIGQSQEVSSQMSQRVLDQFDLTGRVAVITGGIGLLGRKHAEAIAESGGWPVLVDLDEAKSAAAAADIAQQYDVKSLGLAADITRPEAVEHMLIRILEAFGRVDILVNNAAVNPTMIAGAGPDDPSRSRLEHLPLEVWQRDLAVGLTGSFLCSRVIGAEMARRGCGVILNIASDLGLIAPDQRIYQRSGLAPDRQPVKPVTYSVVKHGLIGLTRYLATYWADRGVRANALAPGGVSNDQDDAFVQRLTQLIPLARMARADEYKAAVLFLVSDASSYMTGATLVMDGGRTTW